MIRYKRVDGRTKVWFLDRQKYVTSLYLRGKDVKRISGLVSNKFRTSISPRSVLYLLFDVGLLTHSELRSMDSCLIREAKRVSSLAAAKRRRVAGVRSYIRVAERLDIYERCSGLCTYCARPLIFCESDTYDHAMPIALGGSDSNDNLFLCCKSCNSRKGTGVLLSFLPTRECGLLSPRNKFYVLPKANRLVLGYIDVCS